VGAVVPRRSGTGPTAWGRVHFASMTPSSMIGAVPERCTRHRAPRARIEPDPLWRPRRGSAGTSGGEAAHLPTDAPGGAWISRFHVEHRIEVRLGRLGSAGAEPGPTQPLSTGGYDGVTERVTSHSSGSCCRARLSLGRQSMPERWMLARAAVCLESAAQGSGTRSGSDARDLAAGAHGRRLTWAHRAHQPEGRSTWNMAARSGRPGGPWDREEPNRRARVRGVRSRPIALWRGWNAQAGAKEGASRPTRPPGPASRGGAPFTPTTAPCRCVVRR
jgi:hypothetical protein